MQVAALNEVKNIKYTLKFDTSHFLLKENFKLAFNHLYINVVSLSLYLHYRFKFWLQNTIY